MTKRKKHPNTPSSWAPGSGPPRVRAAPGGDLTGIHIKLNEIADRHSELDKNKNIFVMCHTGTRSQAVVKWLKSKGYEYSVNVLGGIDAWAALIDRNIRRY